MFKSTRHAPVYKTQQIDLRALTLEEAKKKIIEQCRTLGAKIPRDDEERYATSATHRQIRLPLDSVILRMTQTSEPAYLGVIRTTQRSHEHKHDTPKLRVRIKVSLAASEPQVLRQLKTFQEFLEEQQAKDVMA